MSFENVKAPAPTNAIASVMQNVRWRCRTRYNDVNICFANDNHSFTLNVCVCRTNSPLNGKPCCVHIHCIPYNVEYRTRMEPNISIGLMASMMNGTHHNDCQQEVIEKERKWAGDFHFQRYNSIIIYAICNKTQFLWIYRFETLQFRATGLKRLSVNWIKLVFS